MAKDKSYLFDVATAVKYGLNAAVVIRNFQFWIEKNHANEKHRHDGRTWTYISVAAMTEIFPFFSTRQVRTILDNLIKRGVLVKGRFNLKGYDRTSWFAFEDEKSFVKIDKCIGQKRQKDSSKTTNASAGIDKPIPDTNSDINPIEKTDKTTGFSSEFISSRKRDQERTEQTEREAMGLLTARGVNRSVAGDIVVNKKTPLESIRNTIQNGLARQFFSSQKGGSWRLHAGYIVAALKKARHEGKLVKPTKANLKMMAMIEASKNPSKPLSKSEFDKRRKKGLEELRQAI